MSLFSADYPLQFSVLQGSCAGPVFYKVYASTMREIVPQDTRLYGYADDHAVTRAFKAGDVQDELDNKQNLEDCCVKIKEWMDKNRLKMNSSKTEFIMFGHRAQLNKCIRNELNVNSESVARSNEIKYLGAWLDENLSLHKHVTVKCATAVSHLQRIKLIRHNLSTETCHTLVRGLVLSHLDYANAVLCQLPDVAINKMQRVQNASARLICKLKFRESVTKAMFIGYLFIRQRIDYKILCLVHRCMINEAPAYLKDLLMMPTRRGGLRSESDGKRLEVPFTKAKTFAARSVSVHIYGPTKWNSLPKEL